MSRHAFVIGLRPESREEYLRLHSAVWPEVEERLRLSHIRDYSIYLHDGLLFAVYEYTGDDRDADLAAIAADPVTREWWTHTDPLQQRLEGTPEGEQWKPLSPVWTLTP